MNKIIVFLSFILLVSCSPKDNILYVSRYKAVMTQPPKNVPTTKTPDAPLTGNGDIGIVMGGAPNHLTFYFGKNDFWRAYPVYPGGGIALPGSLALSIDALDGADYRVEHIFDEGYIKGRFTKDKLQLGVKAWVSATRNTAFIELQPASACTVRLSLSSPENNTSIVDGGRAGNVLWVTRSFDGTPLLEWSSHVALALSIPSGASLQNDNTLELPAGKTTIIAVTIYTNHDDANWKSRALTEAEAITPQSVAVMQKEHRQWWRDFWNKSNVQIGDSILEMEDGVSVYGEYREKVGEMVE